MSETVAAFQTLPNWGLNLQPRHVPRQGIEPATCQFVGQRPTH